MMFINTPLSVWCQLSSFCFFLAGIYGDLLLIRLFCLMAYLLLMINSIVGSPLWPDISGVVGHIGLDSILWSTICIFVQGSSLISLLFDERPVEDLSDDEEALWRLLYRTAGLSKRLFKELFQELKVLELGSGKLIPTDDYFYVIYQGQVQLQTLDPTTMIPTCGRILVSGEMFDLKYLGLFAADNIFVNGDLVRCTSLTPVRLFQIPKNRMQQMAQHNLAKTAFQALLINNLSFAAESFLNTDTRRSQKAEQYRDKVFRPLKEWEQPPKFAAGSGRALENLASRHLIKALWESISLPIWGHPTGIRQTQLAPPERRRSQNGGETRPQSIPLFHRLSLSFRINRSNRNLNDETSTTSNEIPALVELSGYESTASA